VVTTGAWPPVVEVVIEDAEVLDGRAPAGKAPAPAAGSNPKAATARLKAAAVRRK
jgi:hypothetical protein